MEEKKFCLAGVTIHFPIEVRYFEGEYVEGKEDEPRILEIGDVDLESGVLGVNCPHCNLTLFIQIGCG